MDKDGVEAYRDSLENQFDQQAVMAQTANTTNKVFKDKVRPRSLFLPILFIEIGEWDLGRKDQMESEHYRAYGDSQLTKRSFDESRRR